MKYFRLILLIFLGVEAPAFATVTVSSPSSGSKVTSPVDYVASASASTCSKGVASMGIYVKNKLVYVVDAKQLNTEITLATGAQHTVVQEWDKCGKSSYVTVNLTVVAPKPTVSITANPTSITAGSSSTLTVTASNATKVTLAGTVGSSYTLGTLGGTKSVSPATTATYTATATGSGGSASAKITVTVTSKPTAPTVSISANPTSITAGSSSTLTVVASNATQVTVTGTDHSSYSPGTAGGTITVRPGATTTYTATATGVGGTTATANTQVTVGPNALASISVTPNPAAFAIGNTQQFTATATYTDSSTSDVTQTAAWSVANTAVATVDSYGLGTSVVSGSTSVMASLNGVSGTAAFTVTIAPGTGVNIPTWHGDTFRSGLNPNEQSLSTWNVSSQSFGKLFSYSIHGYAYAQPLLVSGVTINNVVHNVLYVATETNDVYAFDADNGNGTPLWHVTIATPDSVGSGSIQPTIGITSTPVIDTTSNIMYVVSKQAGSGFWLNALDITTGKQALGGPVNISASIPTTETTEFPSGFQTLTTSCIQRTALLEAYGNVYFGFGSCHSGWMLAYDTQTLLQTGIFNSSPNIDGEGQYASAGGVWMGGGGPASNGDGYVYVTTGNGPWDGQTAFSDSILQFNPPTLSPSSPTIMQPASYFTPQYYQYMDCSDGDMASGGLLLIPNSAMALAGAKTAWMYLVNTANLGGEQANDAGALDSLIFEADLGNASNNAAPFTKGCTDSTGLNQIQGSHYEVYGTSAYFNGSVYLGITAEMPNIPAGLRQFTLNGSTLTPSTYTSYGTDQEIRGTTPFISANGTSGGVLWIIDQNEPLGASGYSPAIATLRAFDPNDLGTELYDSNMNPGDAPGYGIKFTSPIVANGKVYISTGTTLETAGTQTGEIDVYGLN